jgi:hypothetical protein
MKWHAIIQLPKRTASHAQASMPSIILHCSCKQATKVTFSELLTKQFNLRLTTQLAKHCTYLSWILHHCYLPSAIMLRRA